MIHAFACWIFLGHGDKVATSKRKEDIDNRFRERIEENRQRQEEDARTSLQEESTDQEDSTGTISQTLHEFHGSDHLSHGGCVEESLDLSTSTDSSCDGFYDHGSYTSQEHRHETQYYQISIYYKQGSQDLENLMS